MLDILTFVWDVDAPSSSSFRYFLALQPFPELSLSDPVSSSSFSISRSRRTSSSANFFSMAFWVPAKASTFMDNNCKATDSHITWQDIGTGGLDEGPRDECWAHPKDVRSVTVTIPFNFNRALKYLICTFNMTFDPSFGHKTVKNCPNPVFLQFFLPFCGQKVGQISSDSILRPDLESSHQVEFS